MPKSLVIVESPAKAHTIHRFLGDDFLVKASMGHLLDLPQKEMGVDIANGFKPRFVIIRGKGKILNGLKKSAAGVEHVYLATDPDREGEAIAYHIAKSIRTDNRHVYRVAFNEITKMVVKKAFQNPGRIDRAKVEAQVARRVMDRLVGYKVSPLLWKTVAKGLSAGRVQSVALRLVCDREREIVGFVPEEYWTIIAELKGKKAKPFLAELIRIDGKKPRIPDQPTADAFVNDVKKKPFVVSDITVKEIKKEPHPPFITSTLQQEIASRLGFSPQKTMAIAQQLYEGIELGKSGTQGLITYMRTDSYRVSQQAIGAVREYILNTYGLEYVPKRARMFKKKGSQEAHEAIRPTSMSLEPKKVKKFLATDQWKLYYLIWCRFVASQMAVAQFKQTTIDINAEEYLFRARGQKVIFRGFLQVYEEPKEEKEGAGQELPAGINVGERLTLLNLLPKQHFTKPPPRYTEGSLIKELDERGIGRPSTYAAIIGTLYLRNYVERRKKSLFPTELGIAVSTILVNGFPHIFNVKFTAQMEEALDRIEGGKAHWSGVVEEFWRPFSQALVEADAKKQEIRQQLQEPAGVVCDRCGSEMVIRWGKRGKFLACSAFPKCRNTRPLVEVEADSEEVCEKCSAPMVLREGRFGKFWACSAYPRCRNTKPYTLGIPCPEDGCDGELVEKKSKRGRVFYGCNRYPKCKFACWDKPVARKCPECGYGLLVEKSSKIKGDYLLCLKCKAEISVETEDR